MIKLVYDCLKAPYDIANILQIVLATEKCELHLTGQSLRHDYPKVLGKVGSWSEKIRRSGLPDLPIYYYDSLEECVKTMHAKGIRLIGTSPQAAKSLFDVDLSGDDLAIVFGTEVGGLSKSKMALVDEVVQIPMSGPLDFMTLSVITPLLSTRFLDNIGGQRPKAWLLIQSSA
ncbi:MAG: TrmH family RNA methyltransferase [Bacillota bacterium]